MNISFDDISLTYTDKEILHQLSFEIPDGQLISLLGPSGCGKSTILNLISGLLSPTKGTIHFGERDVTELDPLQRKVGMVFQNYALYPHMSVLENIAFPMKMEKIPKHERLTKAKELARLVHIDTEINKKPSELSGGQQQRIAIARALAKEPEILLLDEPLSNLDARLRVEMREEIRRIQLKTGVTTIFVTHDQDEAIHISDQILILNDGNIQQFSTPNELYDQPTNLFVAKFVGTPAINVHPFSYFKNDFEKVLPPEILERVTNIGIRSESIVHSHLAKNTLIRLNGHLMKHEQFGRENIAQVDYNNQLITSTNIKKHDQLTNNQIYLLKKGVFFFDESGVKICDGESL